MALNNSVNTSLSGQTGTGAFVGDNSPTITDPIINQIKDADGNVVCLFAQNTPTDVNYVYISANQTGDSAIVSAAGADTNVGLTLGAKGDAAVGIGSEAISSPSILIRNGTSQQHQTNIFFANTPNSRSVTFPDASGTVAFTSDLRPVAPYTVSSVSGEAQFTSVQAAINQAVSDGASSSTPATVWIFAGNYTEDLTLQPYVNLSAATACGGNTGQSIAIGSTIIGNAIYNGTGNICLDNICFQSNTTSAAISLQSTSTSSISCDNCAFQGSSIGTNGVVFECTGAGVIAAITGCTIFGNGAAGTKTINITDGNLLLENCELSPVNASPNAGTISGGAMTFISCRCGDFYSITGGAAGFDRSSISTTTASCITMATPAGITILNSSLNSSASSGFIIDGTGDLSYQDINLGLTSASTVNPAINVSGGRSLFGGIKFYPDIQGIIGVTSGSSSAAGYAGEVIRSAISTGSAVTITSAVSANVTSISLTPGCWNIFGNVGASASITMTLFNAWCSTTSATQPDGSLITSLTGLNGAVNGLTVPMLTLNVSVTTTVYLSVNATFTGTGTAYGQIQAQRFR